MVILKMVLEQLVVQVFKSRLLFNLFSEIQLLLVLSFDTNIKYSGSQSIKLDLNVGGGTLLLVNGYNMELINFINS